MAVAFLHGVEMIEQTVGARPVNAVRSSVIGLVGISPKMPANTLGLVLSNADIAQYGLEIPGFTIPQALNQIFDENPTPVLVVNVFTEADHTTAVALEPVVIASGKGKMAFAPVQAGQGSTVAIFTNVGGTTAFTGVYGTDYTIDDYGNVKALTSVMADATYYMTYKKLNGAAVTASHIVGTETSTARTGMKCWKTAYNTYGFKPKQLIAPGYSTLQPVITALGVEADYYKGDFYLDSSVGITPTAALALRGIGGIWNLSHKRGALVYPGVKRNNPDTNVAETRPASASVAGLVSFVDNTEGYWTSPSNHQFKGITGIERIITWDITDATGTTEANVLNGAGIMAIVTGFGAGNRLWGNSSSFFPANTTPDQFLCVQRTRDVVEDSIEYAMLPFIDKPITLPQIDSIVETVNAFMRELIGRNALIDGSNCKFDPTMNSTTTLAAGQIIFTLTFMSPTPGQRLTFYSRLDISLLKALLPAA